MRKLSDEELLLYSVEILDVMEEALQEHDMQIPSEEREEYDDACIYGSLYFDMEEKIRDILLKMQYIEPIRKL